MIVVSYHCVKPASKDLLAAMLRRDVSEVKVVEVAKTEEFENDGFVFWCGQKKF